MSSQILAFSPTHPSKVLFNCSEVNTILKRGLILLLTEKVLKAKHGLQLFNFFANWWNFSIKLFHRKVTITQLLMPIAPLQAMNQPLLFANKQLSLQCLLQILQMQGINLKHWKLHTLQVLTLA